MKIMRKNNSIIYFSYLYTLLHINFVFQLSFLSKYNNHILIFIIFLCGYFCSPLLWMSIVLPKKNI